MSNNEMRLVRLQRARLIYHHQATVSIFPSMTCKSGVPTNKGIKSFNKHEDFDLGISGKDSIHPLFRAVFDLSKARHDSMRFCSGLSMARP